jgi:dihydroorotate dehydrogenase electron transfer subunit
LRKKSEGLQPASVPCLESAVVVEAKLVAEREFLSKFHAPKIAAAVKAGQFVMASFPGTLDPLLPRAYSVCDIGGENITLFYAAIGKGSKRLSCLKPGEVVRLNGPLGNGFPTPSRGEEIWVVVGGSGAALLPILIKSAKKVGASLQIFYGARTRSQIADFGSDSIQYATDDGSIGYHGTVVQLIRNEMKRLTLSEVERKPSKIFACGPMPMLASLQQEVGTEVQTYLSVETPMACGMGFCQGCPVKIRGKMDYFLACKDGPVFESQQIEFESTIM